MKPVGAFNFGENGNCNKCSKPKEYAEGYFKPFKTVEKIFIG